MYIKMHFHKAVHFSVSDGYEPLHIELCVDKKLLSNSNTVIARIITIFASKYI